MPSPTTPLSASRPVSPLRMARISRGLTLFDVGRAVGMGASLLSQIERGQASISRVRAERISQLLDVPVTALPVRVARARPSR